MSDDDASPPMNAPPRWVCFDCHREKTVVVPAADYDALAAESLASLKRSAETREAVSKAFQERIAQLETRIAALEAEVREWRILINGDADKAFAAGID